MLRRQLIRNTTVGLLKAAGTFAGDRVYPTKLTAWRRELPLPAIGVSTMHERSESVALGGGNSGPFQLRQSLELSIEVVTELPTTTGQTPADRAALDAQAPLDALCAQITLALLTDPSWRIFEGLERWETRIEAARPEESDRRTMAATILAVINYTCIAEPTIEDYFCTAFFDVDVIDPAADPNIKYPGPDGRIEVSFAIPRPTDPPLCPPEVNPLGGHH
jgi:hypothetical protein